ncbi:MAG: molybdopterin adenylyltransferase [Candidatus Cyclobacteriaceae bacterium M2_1C_046]
MSKLVIGVINVSDRASRGEYEDIPGKEVVKLLKEIILSDFDVEYAVVPDEQDQLESTLLKMSDNNFCGLIVTTGGTGPSKRDVTPEATEAVCEKVLPGFGELMRKISLNYVPTAILSRQMAGIRKNTLIINLPGKPQAIRQCMEAIIPAIPDCLDLLEHSDIKWNEDCLKTYRPHMS